MSDISAVLNIPILQAFGVILLIGIAERVGIPVIAGLKGLMKIEDKAGKVDTLASYYNHDLTEKLDRIEKAEEKEHEANERMRETLTSIDRTLSEFREYGIKHRI